MRVCPLSYQFLRRCWTSSAKSHPHLIYLAFFYPYPSLSLLSPFARMGDNNLTRLRFTPLTLSYFTLARRLFGDGHMFPC